MVTIAIAVLGVVLTGLWLLHLRETRALRAALNVLLEGEARRGKAPESPVRAELASASPMSAVSPEAEQSEDRDSAELLTRVMVRPTTAEVKSGASAAPAPSLKRQRAGVPVPAPPVKVRPARPLPPVVAPPRPAGSARSETFRAPVEQAPPDGAQEK
jgi:hypothetical protein